VTIFPWLIRNYEVWGKAKLSSAGWYILSTLNAPEYLKFWKYFPSAQPTDIPAPPVCDSNQKTSWNFDCENQYKNYVMAVCAANPSAALSVHAIGAVTFFLGDGYMNILHTFWPEIKPPDVLFGARNLEELPQVPFRLTDWYRLVFWVGKFFWVIIYSFMLWGIILSFKNREWLFWILLFLGIIASIVLPAGAIAYARYRFSVSPLIFLMFAYGLELFLSRRRRAD
jgi:hypothetical protein